MNNHNFKREITNQDAPLPRLKWLMRDDNLTQTRFYRYFFENQISVYNSGILVFFGLISTNLSILVTILFSETNNSIWFLPIRKYVDILNLKRKCQKIKPYLIWGTSLIITYLVWYFIGFDLHRSTMLGLPNLKLDSFWHISLAVFIFLMLPTVNLLLAFQKQESEPTEASELHHQTLTSKLNSKFNHQLVYKILTSINVFCNSCLFLNYADVLIIKFKRDSFVNQMQLNLKMIQDQKELDKNHQIPELALPDSVDNFYGRDQFYLKNFRDFTG